MKGRTVNWNKRICYSFLFKAPTTRDLSSLLTSINPNDQPGKITPHILYINVENFFQEQKCLPQNMPATMSGFRHSTSKKKAFKLTRFKRLLQKLIWNNLNLEAIFWGDYTYISRVVIPALIDEKCSDGEGFAEEPLPAWPHKRQFSL